MSSDYYWYLNHSRGFTITWTNKAGIDLLGNLILIKVPGAFGNILMIFFYQDIKLVFIVKEGLFFSQQDFIE